MSTNPRSFLRRLLSHIPMPILAAVFGLGAGLVAWAVIDRIQTEALSKIFNEELESQLHQRARESLVRFDTFMQSYTAVTRLLANHRRMADYLEPVIWFQEEDISPIVYPKEQRPSWLPDPGIWRATLQPSHVLLVDPDGHIREEYQVQDVPVPLEFSQEASQSLVTDKPLSYLTSLGDTMYLLVSERVEDASYNIMGSLVLLVPIDEDFLSASQQRVNSGGSIVAIVDGDVQKVLTSNDQMLLPKGSVIEDEKRHYVVTAQSFFQYEDSAQNVLFATFVPRAGIEATGASVLDLERRQRLTGGAIIVGVFVLLFVFISSRISRLLRRVSTFSRKAMEFDQPEPRRGNQLLILEDWMREFVQMVLMARDQARVKHAAEMQETEALKTAIMDTSLDPIITIDQRGRVIDFNPTAERTFGISRDAAIGQQLDYLILSPGSREAFHVQLHDSLLEFKTASDPTRRNLTAVSHDSREFPVEMAIKPMMLDDRLFFTTYVHDISERKRQAQEIESLAAFPSEIPIPVLRVNRPGVIIYANSSSEPLLNYWGCKRLQTLPVYWKQQVEGILASGKPREIELPTDDGIFSLFLAPVSHLGYVNIYARDITEIRRAEGEAQRRQNELIHVARLSTMGEMATGIAHELNQPLSAIVNYANGCVRRLRSGVGEKDELLEALAQISTQANRAGEIIKRLRSMVTRQQPVRMKMDLNSLVNEVCSLVSHERKKLQIAIEKKLSSDVLPVNVDPVLIEQVILNLVRNAFDALEEQEESKRRLLIKTGNLDDNRIFVSVTDTGKGIDPRDMEHLFDPFFSTKKTGMGMGLSISKTIIDEHKGQIYASSWPGKGSTFTIELPASTEAIKSIAL